MSLTRTVPPVVPSDFQSSAPFVPSSAVKKTVPPTLVRRNGAELSGPGRMSFTRLVPALVPSLFQSSVPATPSLAANSALPFRTTSREGEESSVPVGLSFTRIVVSSDSLVLQSDLREHILLTFALTIPQT